MEIKEIKKNHYYAVKPGWTPLTIPVKAIGFKGSGLIEVETFTPFPSKDKKYYGCEVFVKELTLEQATRCASILVDAINKVQEIIK